MFASNFNDAYKNVLALTFTNKAVGEMKNRIIETLFEFSDELILNSNNSMLQDLCDELSTTPEILHQKAKIILEHLMHNYGAFEVSTIDKFTQRVIRTFARDLNLPQNFEVELDTDLLLHKAVDNVIAKAGTDPLLTKALIDFALEHKANIIIRGLRSVTDFHFERQLSYMNRRMRHDPVCEAQIMKCISMYIYSTNTNLY